MRRASAALLLLLAATAVAQDAEETVGTVRGAVVDAAGRPVAGASVRVTSAVGRQRNGETSDDGRFLLAGAAPGPARVLVLSRESGAALSGWFDLRRGAAADVGWLRAHPGWTVSGEVTGADGEPVSARVGIRPVADVDPEAWALLEQQSLFDGIEGGDEGFEVRWLPPGTYCIDVFRPASRDEQPCLTRRVVVPAAGSGTIPVRIELPPRLTPRNVTVRVRAEDADGNALQRFGGGLSNDTWGYSFGARNGEASVTCWGVPPLRLSVHGEGLLPSEMDVMPRAEPYVVRLERRDEQLEVDGVVTLDGEPISWSRVRHCFGTNSGAKFALTATPLAGGPARPILSYLASDGRFGLTLPRAGAWRLRVSGDDVWQPRETNVPLPSEVVVLAGARDVELPLTRGVPLSVDLRLREGARADEYAARLIDESGSTSRRRCSTFDVQGTRVVFPSVRPDSSYTLLAAARVGERWTDTVRVGGLRAGEPSGPVTLPPGRLVGVRVVRADGTPVVGARVRRAAGLDATAARTRAGGGDGGAGLAELTVPRSGTATLAADAPGLGPAGAAVPVSADDDEVTIELRPLPLR